MARCATRSAWEISLQPQRHACLRPGPIADANGSSVPRYPRSVCAGQHVVVSATANTISKDEAGSVAWFKSAADRGAAEAQRNYGNFLQFGRGCEKNEEEAMKWYEKASLQGHADADFSLGFCYAHARGTDKDEKVAAEHFRKAADKGHTDAMRSLAVLYKYGRGVTKDPEEAEALFQKAASGPKSTLGRSLGYMMAHAPRYVGGALGSSEYKMTLKTTKKRPPLLESGRKHLSDPPH